MLIIPRRTLLEAQVDMRDINRQKSTCTTSSEKPLIPQRLIPKGNRHPGPEHSNANMNDYVWRLWDLCWTAYGTTFGALYLWSGVWYVEMGNVHDFHLAPVQPSSNQGDFSSWQIIWRQGWYVVIIAQLVSMAPPIISAFMSGVLS